jgi:putative MFS transporter
LDKQIDYKDAPMVKVDWQIFIGFFLGQIACSYTLGVAGTALNRAQNILNINSFWMGLLGAGTLIGLFGSLFVGHIADNIGRRKLFLVDMWALVIISLLQLTTTNLTFILIIRILLGICIAIDYTVGSSLMTEWLPTNKYSKFQSFLLLFWITGYVVAYLVGTFTPNLGPHTWQIILASTSIIGLLPAIQRLIVRQPESPSWLINKGRNEEAQTLIHKYIGKNYFITDPGQKTRKKVSWSELFSKRLWKHTVVGGMFYACQTFPFFGISIFLPILMQNMHIHNPYMSEILYNLFMIVGVVIGIIIFLNFKNKLATGLK